MDRGRALFLVEEGKQLAVDFAEPESQFSVDNIRWTADGNSFTFDYNKRGHQKYVVYKVNGNAP